MEKKMRISKSYSNMDLKELVEKVAPKEEDKQLVVEEYINPIKLPSPRTPKKDPVAENDSQLITPPKAVFQRRTIIVME